jgi:hypothetical protein
MKGAKIIQSNADFTASFGQTNSQVAQSMQLEPHFSFPFFFSDMLLLGHFFIQRPQLSHALLALNVLLYMNFANGRATNILSKLYIAGVEGSNDSIAMF